MRPRPGRTSPGTCQGFMGCRPVGRERQDAGRTARSCFVWPRHRQRVTDLLAYGWAYCKRAEGPSVFELAAHVASSMLQLTPPAEQLRFEQSLRECRTVERDEWPLTSW